MKITVELPAEVNYLHTMDWYIDAADDWTVAKLCEDVERAARCEALTASVDAAPLTSNAMAADVLSHGDVVTFAFAEA